uniref:Reverse transcriptase domain-containing protein n=1 Tax=Schistocephalus solidus TaxID=70667 RepID=A0A0V0J8V2_SCHSO
MQKFGCHDRFPHMVRQLRDGTMARVTDNRTVSEAFAASNGVKHGCVQNPIIFSLKCSLVFADYCTLNATRERGMQRSIDLFAAACDNFGLRNNTDKTTFIHKPPPNTTYNELASMSTALN